jgi:hypothetical protein
MSQLREIKDNTGKALRATQIMPGSNCLNMFAALDYVGI